MESRGELRIDPASLVPSDRSPGVEVAILYTDSESTRALLSRAATLTAGLDARIHLIAVHTVPYPRDFECPATVHAYLVEQLLQLSAGCSLPVDPIVVLARSREEGLQFALQPESTILIASARRLWRTPEEALARTLAREGHKVALVHLD